MPKLTVTVSDTITYSDSEGRKYKGPLKDAPPYVRESVEDMNKMLQSLDDSCSSLLHRASGKGVGTKSYKMTFGRSFDWVPIIAVGLGILAGLIFLALKLLVGE